MKRREFMLAAGAGALASMGVMAQESSQQITIYVPFAPGGPLDVLARVLGEEIRSKTGKVVIIDNRPGAGGQLAGNAVKQSQPGSLSLFIGDWAILGSNAALYKNFSYDPLKDFQPITALASFPMVLYINASNPASSIEELIAQSKKRGLSYASQGQGTAGHLLGIMLQSKFNADLVHIPYRGSAPAMQDLLANNVDILFDALPAGYQHVAGGRLKALAVMSDHRSSLLPNVPTASEIGAGDLNMDVWFGVVARKGLSESTMSTLNEEFVNALNSKTVVARFKGMGFDVTPMSIERFDAYMKSEFKRWSELIKRHDISVN